MLIGSMFAGVPAAGQHRPGDTELPDAKPVPALQVIPLPHDQASFRLGPAELTRYHFGPSLRRPFLYPLLGPGASMLVTNAWRDAEDRTLLVERRRITVVPGDAVWSDFFSRLPLSTLVVDQD